MVHFKGEDFEKTVERMVESVEESGAWRSIIALGQACERVASKLPGERDAEHMQYLAKALEGLGHAFRNLPEDHV